MRLSTSVTHRIATVASVFWLAVLSVSGCNKQSTDTIEASSATPHALNVSTQGNGVVRSNPAGINCGSDCTENFLTDTQVTLTPIPGEGFQFVAWSGDCTGSAVCQITMDSNKTVTGSFTPITGAPQINVLSNRADLISGGDALVEVLPPEGFDASQLRIQVDARDVSPAFAQRPNGRYQALISGLAPGPNIVRAMLPSGLGAAITITNHSRGGPIFSGPQLQPWACAPGASDAQCTRPVSYEFFYVSTDPIMRETCDSVPSTVTNQVPETSAPPCLQPYDPANPPSDVGTTKTDEGTTVPHIVRLETGTLDRDQYKVAVLYNPEEPWSRWTPQPGWNHKLLIKHGSSCGATYAEGEAPDVLDEGRALSRGFAVMSTALNNSGHNCNVVLQAESMIMAKEHVIETYGDLRYTIGRGGSGGALAQQWVANAYPGLYNGLLVSQSFPDAWSVAQEVEDCSLLLGYWTDPSKWAPGVTWSDAQQAGVEGHQSTSVCKAFVTVFAYDELFDPAKGRSCKVPDSQRYNAQTNPQGTRCTLQDYTVNVLGRRLADAWGGVEQQIGRGFANRPFDNVGIQYGLEALRSGTITPAQFVDLNAKLGARDIDHIPQAARVRADPGALATAYRSGLINQANNMDQVAIIDRRGTNSAEIHHHVRTRVMRERLDRANGHHDNHVIWWGQEPISGDSSFSSAASDLMDGWLAAIEGDTSADSLEVKIVRNKPAAAKDRCTNGSGTELPSSACQLPDGTPRIAASGPLSDDLVACQLKPLNRADDYGSIPFTEAQWQNLQAIFQDGVCDYAKPGVNQEPTVPWLTYQDGAGGQPLGPVPRSIPFQ